MKKTDYLPVTARDVTTDHILTLEVQKAQALFNAMPLEEKINVVLSAPWLQRQKLIILAENPEELVRALPEDEVYWTVKEIGLEDALPIISHLSFEQLQYNMDIDCWTKDLIDMAAVTRWFKVLLRCREEQVLEWVSRADERFLNFAFKKLFNVYRLSDDIDLSEASDLLPSWTIDGLYYFQFADEEARMVAIPFLHLLYRSDSKYFYFLMENTRWVSAIELEEDVLRMRQRRMAEQGFPELDEAWQVYQPLSLKEMKELQERGHRRLPVQETSPSTHQWLRYRFTLDTRNRFVHAALKHIEDPHIAAKVQQEIISLANTVMIADCIAVREHQDKQAAFSKVMGYVSIGLDYVSRHDAEAAVRLLEETPAFLLFRAGYSQALDLRSRALGICRELRDIHPRLQQDFFGTPWGEMIAGLTRSRPLFFEGIIVEAGSSDFREFETTDDIDAARQALDAAAMIKRVLFDCFGLAAAGVIADSVSGASNADISEIRAQQLFNTVFARHILYGTTDLAPVTAAELRQFLSGIFSTAEHAEAASAVMATSLLSDTMDWLQRQYVLADDAMPALQSFVQNCLNLLAQECGALAGAVEIDTRYISAFLFRR